VCGHGNIELVVDYVMGCWFLMAPTLVEKFYGGEGCKPGHPALLLSYSYLIISYSHVTTDRTLYPGSFLLFFFTLSFTHRTCIRPVLDIYTVVLSTRVTASVSLSDDRLSLFF